MSGTTEEKPLSNLEVVAATTGLRILGFTPAGLPKAVEPAAFAQAPTGSVGLTSAAPLADDVTPSAGNATTAARADHRHIFPTAGQIGAAATVHTHAIVDVANLQAALDAKSPTAHTHAISAVNGLQAALDAKAALAHSHAIADVSGLQNAIDLKLNIAARGAVNGVAPLGADGKVPATALPPASVGVTNVNNGTVDGQIPIWNNTTQKYDPASPINDDLKRINTVERNSPTVLSFSGYNNKNIVLSGNAPLTLAATEIGTTPNIGMHFIVRNHHTAVNTLTFGAGITVNPIPAGTGTGGAVKIGANGGFAAVHVYPLGAGLVATVTGILV